MTVKRSGTTVYILDAEWVVPEDSDVVLDAQRLHCIVLKEFRRDNTIKFYGEMEGDAKSLLSFKHWLQQHESITLVGHNILNADLEVFRNLLDIPFTVGSDTIAGVPAKFVDTFTLSKRLNPDRPMAYYKGKSCGQHGLKAWGIRTGLAKPEVEDWTSQPIEVYLHRCEQDVLNNEATYEMLLEEMEG